MLTTVNYPSVKRSVNEQISSTKQTPKTTPSSPSPPSTITTVVETGRHRDYVSDTENCTTLLSQSTTPGITKDSLRNKKDNKRKTESSKLVISIQQKQPLRSSASLNTTSAQLLQRRPRVCESSVVNLNSSDPRMITPDKFVNDSDNCDYDNVANLLPKCVTPSTFKLGTTPVVKKLFGPKLQYATYTQIQDVTQSLTELLQSEGIYQHQQQTESPMLPQQLYHQGNKLNVLSALQPIPIKPEVFNRSSVNTKNLYFNQYHCVHDLFICIVQVTSLAMLMKNVVTLVDTHPYQVTYRL
ncbi:unnamed protein product [Schistosoma mattheei]|uniref:Uncharacterized protein n=1 Tax=Schistosoma mattheei TaxID=31246 RepID=A0A183PBP5_9TREM|nr:unnamed protein product [Schistosoma mattheei]